MTVLSQKDFAEAIGRDKSYITRLKQAGHLVMTEDGRVDVEPSLERLQASTGNTPAGRAHQERWEEYRRRNRPQPAATGTQPGGTGEAIGATAKDDYAHQKAQAVLRKLKADAERAAMELAILKDEYVRKSDILHAMATANGVIQNAIIGVEDRLAPLLGIKDEDLLRTRALIRDEMEYVLETASRELSALAGSDCTH